MLELKLWIAKELVQRDAEQLEQRSRSRSRGTEVPEVLRYHRS
jgi:hypothetical protein